MYSDLQIETYILKKPVYDIADLEKDPYSYLIHLQHEKVEAIELLRGKVENPFNRAIDIEGSIYICYKGREVSPLIYWDEVDSLWAYYLNLIEEYLENGYATCYFPGQPIPIILKKGSNNMLFSVNNVEILVEERYFLSKLLNKAQEFFDFLSNISLNNFYENEISQIKSILAKIG